jgi:hypothetical protein
MALSGLEANQESPFGPFYSFRLSFAAAGLVPKTGNHQRKKKKKIEKNEKKKKKAFQRGRRRQQQLERGELLLDDALIAGSRYDYRTR